MISENNGKSPAQTEAANTAVQAKPQVDAGRLSLEAGMLAWIILAAAVLFIFFGIFRNETRQFPQGCDYMFGVYRLLAKSRIANIQSRGKLFRYRSACRQCLLAWICARRNISRADKQVCLPVNCYSCPGAIGAAPRLLQSSMQIHINVYHFMSGLLILLGGIFAVLLRLALPFGLIQEWLHKIPGRKFKPESNKKIHNVLRRMPLVFSCCLRNRAAADRYDRWCLWISLVL